MAQSNVNMSKLKLADGFHYTYLYLTPKRCTDKFISYN